MAQKKVKEMAEEVVVTETKEVDFGDLELKIEKPVLNKDKAVTIGGNWDNLKANIKKVVDKYKGTQLTEDNVDYVKSLKKQFVSLRTGVELDFKNYKTAYLDPAENLIKAVKAELLAVIDEGESALDKQLDEYDQRRKDELTVILKDYVAESVEKYHLRDEYATQIQLKKNYYNKTAKEEDTIADIDAQAKELAEQQSAYDNGVALIKAECEESGLLPDAYIRELSYRNAMEIIMEIKQDKKAQAELKAKAEEGEKVTIGADVDSELAKQMAKATSLPEEGGKVTIGADVDSELAKQMAKATSLPEDEERTRVLRVTYKASQAKTIASFFKHAGIKFEFINSDF